MESGPTALRAARADAITAGRKFRPHITIGRVVRRGVRPLEDLIGGYGEELFGVDEVREFVFMKSILGREHALHAPLWNVALRQRREEPRNDEPRSEEPRSDEQ